MRVMEMSNRLDNESTKYAGIAAISIVVSLVVAMFGGYFWEISRDRLRPKVDMDSEAPLEVVGEPGGTAGFI